MRGTLLCSLIILLNLVSVVSAQSSAEQQPLNPLSQHNRETEFVNQLLSLLQDAIITRLDARVSLEGLEVEQGRVVLRGVLLQNLNVGLRLDASGARRFAQALQNRAEQNRASAASEVNGQSTQSQSTQSQSTQSAQNQWAQILEILKLGLFNNLEVSVRLRELRVRRLSLDADALQVEGLLLQVGATPPDPVTGKPRGTSLETLMAILRQTTLSRITAHAGLDKLAARRLKLKLEGIALQGLAIEVLLLQQDAEKAGAQNAIPQSENTTSQSANAP